jgi:hypothetical protein
MSKLAQVLAPLALGVGISLVAMLGLACSIMLYNAFKRCGKLALAFAYAAVLALPAVACCWYRFTAGNGNGDDLAWVRSLAGRVAFMLSVGVTLGLLYVWCLAVLHRIGARLRNSWQHHGLLDIGAVAICGAVGAAVGLGALTVLVARPATASIFVAVLSGTTAAAALATWTLLVARRRASKAKRGDWRTV